jgi:hypothetical protein
MPRISIKPPVKAKTKGGMDATIFEIDSDDLQDGLSGIIYTPGMGEIAKSWSDVGICSNASDECNLDPLAPEVAAVIRKLLAARS